MGSKLIKMGSLTAFDTRITGNRDIFHTFFWVISDSLEYALNDSVLRFLKKPRFSYLLLYGARKIYGVCADVDFFVFQIKLKPDFGYVYAMW